MSLVRGLIGLAGMSLLVSCGEPSDSEDKGDQNKLEICSENDEECVTSSFSETLLNVKQVEETYDPPAIDALSIDEDASQLADNPCADAPQTRLGSEPCILSLYVDIAKRALNAAHGALHMVEPQLHQIEDKSGSIELGGDTVSYSLESDEKFEFLIKGGGDFDTYLKVDGTAYTLKSENRNETTGPETTHAEIVYEDEQNWTVRSKITSPKCATRPMVIVVDMQMADGLWLGKAMTYRPSDEDTCKKDASDDARYTDFVGDKTFTTVSLYTLPISFTDFSTIEDYDWGDTDSVNPICMEVDKDPTEDGACTSSTHARVQNATYSDAKLWEVPGDLQQLDLSFPESL